MRTLIYVPIIHTTADLGSMAKDITKTGVATLGEQVWTKHRSTVEGFWNAISSYFDSIEVKDMKIYQDGLVADGEIGEKIVEETSKAGSKNYQLISKLLGRGAVLVKTEDFPLVKEEYNRLLAITQAKSTVRKIIAIIKYKSAKNRLLKKRDTFITQRINETLGPGEKGIIFIGAFHKIRDRLHKNIQVIEVKDREKVKKYHRLLPFHYKHKDQFDELGEYLVSKAALADGVVYQQTKTSGNRVGRKPDSQIP